MYKKIFKLICLVVLLGNISVGFAESDFENDFTLIDCMVGDDGS